MSSRFGRSGDVDWQLELERDRLLPGRLVAGRVTVTARKDVEARALEVALKGEERYRYVVSTGKTTTVVTGKDDLPPVRVPVTGPLHLARGESRTLEFSLPVPPLGPASLDAKEAAIEWQVEAKLDIAGGGDSRIEAPVRVLQPVALLRAGVVHVGEFALYDAADAEAAGVTGSIKLDPVPLVAGERFTGRLVIRAAKPVDVTDIRAEVRVEARCTMANGLKETIVPWRAEVCGATRIEGEHVFEIEGTLEDRALPTIEREKLAASGEVHVILGRRFARDPHLVRDIAIATTSAL